MRTQDIFIEGTIRTVAEVGMENTTTKEIAKRVQYSGGNIYNHFDGKDDLLTKAFLEVDRRVTNQFDLSHLAEGDLSEQIKALWTNFFGYLLDHPNETLFYIRFRYSSLYTLDLEKGHLFLIDPVITRLTELANEISSVTKEEIIFAFRQTMITSMTCAEKIITGKSELNEQAINQTWDLVHYIICAPFMKHTMSL